VTERSGTSREDDPGVHIRRLHEHLRATAERPVEPAASRCSGEAEAVAGDLVGATIDPAAREERVGH
jgi:hypothetical protein